MVNVNANVTPQLKFSNFPIFPNIASKYATSAFSKGDNQVADTISPNVKVLITSTNKKIDL